ncbi:MAG: TIGR03960 family B12-binding radical SAM protein [Eggerthellaceae bacterium]|nr:TIGR03960 family B12-binding radical SAM protein [Eggerthellaceae bacterium]
MRSLKDQIENILLDVEHPSRYTNSELYVKSGAVVPGERVKFAGFSRPASPPHSDVNFCMCYPDMYEIGQSNQAVRILCNRVNNAKDTGIIMSAQRAFLPAPDMISKMRNSGIELFSLETKSPLKDFDLLGITMPHELAATNILELISLAGMKISSKDREESDPVIIAGAPCSYNPEPYAQFIDLFFIGEGEEGIVEVLKVIASAKKEGLTKLQILKNLDVLDYLYIPALYNPASPKKIIRKIYKGFAESPAFEDCIVPFVQCEHDRLNVEILRGCARNCRFCQAGQIYRPVRERSAQNIIESVETGLRATGYEELSLTSLSSTDHSQIEEILSTLNKKYYDSDIKISIPSQRMDAFGTCMAHLVAGKKKGGLTFAPEAGTQRLRNVINKNITDDDIVSAIESAFSSGWLRCKLYFMIGLPTETQDDLQGIIDLSNRILQIARDNVAPKKKSAVKVNVSMSIFVPKCNTPFQYFGQISMEEARSRAKFVKANMGSKSISVNYHEPYNSMLEACICKGDRSVAKLIQAAWEEGAVFDAWTDYFDNQAWERAQEKSGIDAKALAQRNFDLEERLPWEHIDCGVSQDFFKSEYELALNEGLTNDCSFGKCHNCGLCPSYKTKNQIAGKRSLVKSAVKPVEHTDTVQYNGKNMVFKIRISYKKPQRLAMISHRELTKAIERLVRRTGLPYVLSQGYNPHIKLSFGSALPVGVASECEIFDLQLSEYVLQSELLKRLVEANNGVFEIMDCEYIEIHSLAASVAYKNSVYEVEFDNAIESAPKLPEKIVAKRKNGEKVYVIASFLKSLTRKNRRMQVTLESKPTGTLRIDLLCGEIAQLNGLKVKSITRIEQF